MQAAYLVLVRQDLQLRQARRLVQAEGQLLRECGIPAKAQTRLQRCSTIILALHLHCMHRAFDQRSPGCMQPEVGTASDDRCAHLALCQPRLCGLW